MGKYTIDEQIQIERDSLEVAIFPRERREHAERLARLEKERMDMERIMALDEEMNIAMSKEIV